MAGAEWFIAHYFCRAGRDSCIILEHRLKGKPRVVHLYPALMECGNGCLAFQGGGRLEKDSG